MVFYEERFGSVRFNAPQPPQFHVAAPAVPAGAAGLDAGSADGWLQLQDLLMRSLGKRNFFTTELSCCQADAAATVAQ